MIYPPTVTAVHKASGVPDVTKHVQYSVLITYVTSRQSARRGVNPGGPEPIGASVKGT